MEKEFLVTKISDQKKAKEYNFYRNLKIDDGIVDLNSFNQFIELENADKNLAFFVTDEIKFLSFANPKKFFKYFLKEYKNFIDNGQFPQIYLDIKDDILDQKLNLDGIDELKVVHLNDNKNKTK